MMHRCPSCGHKLIQEEVVSWGGWTYDPLMHRVNDSIQLSPHEGIFFQTLLEAQGRGVTKDMFMTAAYGQSYDAPEIKIVDVRRMNVRKKLKKAGFPNAIYSIYGGRCHLTRIEDARLAAG